MTSSPALSVMVDSMAAQGCTPAQIAGFVRAHVVGKIEAVELTERQKRRIANKASWAANKDGANKDGANKDGQVEAEALPSNKKRRAAKADPVSRIAMFEKSLAGISPAEASALLAELEALDRSATG